jgi:hypothetical protein
MPTNHTPNYNLNQWERDDRVLMEDFNADNAKIDAALGAHTETLTAHTAALALRGNCRVETFSYTGKSQDGHGLTNSFTFSKRPAFVLILGFNSSILLMPGQSDMGIFVGSYAALNGRTVLNIKFTWKENTATIDNIFKEVRMDAQGVAYHAIVWIPVDGET